MSNQLVTYERKGRVAEIRLNRPEKLNAITDEVFEELSDAMYRLDGDDDAWIGILSGNGRAFCAGADVQKRMGTAQARGVRGGVGVKDVFLARFQNYKPVITAVHGYAYGAGLVLVLHSDLVVADETAKFQVTEVPRGLDSTSLWAFLNLRVPGGIADELCLTGRIFSGHEAAQYGVANRVVPAGQHEESAHQLAEELLASPPLGIRATVRAKRARLEMLETRTSIDRRERTLHESADFRESIAAMKEKRDPIFLGK